jgi:hypothetical protein
MNQVSFSIYSSATDSTLRPLIDWAKFVAASLATQKPADEEFPAR